MCSNQDGGDLCCKVTSLLETKIESDFACKKCSIKPDVLLQRRHAYCKMCFLSTVNHKFRSSLGKTKVTKCRDKVLIAFSGNASTTALLHLVHRGISDVDHKRLMFQAVVVFIDETILLDVPMDREKILMEIQIIPCKFHFKTYVIAASAIFENKLNGSHIHLLSGCGNEAVLDFANAEDDLKLTNLFKEVHGISSKLELLKNLRMKLLVKIAEYLKCDRILTGETANDLAVTLFSNVAFGRGNQLHRSSAISDKRNANVELIRPLREITSKEIEYYNVFNDLEAIFIPSITTLLPKDCSIQKMTESFLTNLQEEFPSTVYTVMRTGDKLNKNDCNLSNRNICDLCANDVSNDNNGSLCNESEIKIENSSRRPLLCYGCKLIACKDAVNMERISNSKFKPHETSEEEFLSQLPTNEEIGN